MACVRYLNFLSCNLRSWQHLDILSSWSWEMLHEQDVMYVPTAVVMSYDPVAVNVSIAAVVLRWCWSTDHVICSMIDVWKTTEVIRISEPVYIGAGKPWSLVISSLINQHGHVKQLHTALPERFDRTWQKASKGHHNNFSILNCRYPKQVHTTSKQADIHL